MAEASDRNIWDTLNEVKTQSFSREKLDETDITSHEKSTVCNEQNGGQSSKTTPNRRTPRRRGKMQVSQDEAVPTPQSKNSSINLPSLVELRNKLKFDFQRSKPSITTKELSTTQPRENAHGIHTTKPAAGEDQTFRANKSDCFAKGQEKDKKEQTIDAKSVEDSPTEIQPDQQKSAFDHKGPSKWNQTVINMNIKEKLRVLTKINTNSCVKNKPSETSDKSETSELRTIRRSTRKCSPEKMPSFKIKLNETGDHSPCINLTKISDVAEQPLDLSVKKLIHSRRQRVSGNGNLREQNVPTTARAGVFQTFTSIQDPPIQRVSPVRPHIRGKPANCDTTVSHLCPSKHTVSPSATQMKNSSHRKGGHVEESSNVQEYSQVDSHCDSSASSNFFTRIGTDGISSNGNCNLPNTKCNVSNRPEEPICINGHESRLSLLTKSRPTAEVKPNNTAENTPSDKVDSQSTIPEKQVNITEQMQPPSDKEENMDVDLNTNNYEKEANIVVSLGAPSATSPPHLSSALPKSRSPNDSTESVPMPVLSPHHVTDQHRDPVTADTDKISAGKGTITSPPKILRVCQVDHTQSPPFIHMENTKVLNKETNLSNEDSGRYEKLGLKPLPNVSQDVTKSARCLSFEDKEPAQNGHSSGLTRSNYGVSLRRSPRRSKRKGDQLQGCPCKDSRSADQFKDSTDFSVSCSVACTGEPGVVTSSANNNGQVMTEYNRSTDTTDHALPDHATRTLCSPETSSINFEQADSLLNRLSPFKPTLISSVKMLECSRSFYNQLAFTYDVRGESLKLDIRESKYYQFHVAGKNVASATGSRPNCKSSNTGSPGEEHRKKTPNRDKHLLASGDWRHDLQYFKKHSLRIPSPLVCCPGKTKPGFIENPSPMKRSASLSDVNQQPKRQKRVSNSKDQFRNKDANSDHSQLSSRKPIKICKHSGRKRRKHYFELTTVTHNEAVVAASAINSSFCIDRDERERIYGDRQIDKMSTYHFESDSGKSVHVHNVLSTPEKKPPIILKVTSEKIGSPMMQQIKQEMRRNSQKSTEEQCWKLTDNFPNLPSDYKEHPGVGEQFSTKLQECAFNTNANSEVNLSSRQDLKRTCCLPEVNRKSRSPSKSPKLKLTPPVKSAASPCSVQQPSNGANSPTSSKQPRADFACNLSQDKLVIQSEKSTLSLGNCKEETENSLHSDLACQSNVIGDLKLLPSGTGNSTKEHSEALRDLLTNAFSTDDGSNNLHTVQGNNTQEAPSLDTRTLRDLLCSKQNLNIGGCEYDHTSTKTSDIPGVHTSTPNTKHNKSHSPLKFSTFVALEDVKNNDKLGYAHDDNSGGKGKVSPRWARKTNASRRMSLDSTVKKKRSLLDQLANTDGYIAEKRLKKNCDSLYEDPANLGREDRALQGYYVP